MSRRQKQALNFILEDAYEALILYWLFANIMVENTWLGTLGPVNEGIYHTGRIAFLSIVCITAVRAVRDGSAKTVRMYVVLLAGILSAFSGANLWMLETAILAIGLRGMNIERLLKKAGMVLTAATALIILLAVSGMITGEAVSRSDGPVRRSFGFSHPNVFGMRIFQIAVMYLYARAGKGIRLADSAAVFLAGIFVYVAADSRTTTILLLLLGAAAFVFAVEARPKAGNAVLAGGFLRTCFRALPAFSVLIPPAAILGTLWLARLPQTATVKSTVWSRVHQSLSYYQYYGLSWHGRALMDRYSPGAPAGLYTLDNGYMYLLLGFGVFAFSLFVVGEICLTFRTAQAEKWMLLVILVLYLLFGMFETSFIRPHSNFFVLLFAEVLWPEKKRNNLELSGGNREYTADRT